MNQSALFLQGFLKQADDAGVPQDQALAALSSQIGGAGGPPPDAGGGQLSPEQLQGLIQVLTQMLAAEQGGAGAPPPDAGAPAGGPPMPPPDAGAAAPPPPDAGMPKAASDKAICDTEEYISSFVKRASEYGYNEQQAVSIYKEASAYMKQEADALEKQAAHFEGFYTQAKQANLGLDDNQIVEAYKQALQRK